MIARHFHRIGLTLICASVLLVAACGTSATSSRKGSTTTVSTVNIGPPEVDGVAYGPHPLETLNLCLPQVVKSPRPGVILVHGGSWSGGTPNEYSKVCAYLATQGIVVANLSYRLAPANIWPAQLVDAQLAVRWLRANAAKYELDPRRLCSWGDSAGGHLALFLGLMTAIHPGDEASLYANQAPNVGCIVDEFGPTDLAQPAQTDLQRSILQTFLGVPLAANPTLYRDASPLFDVTPQSPPVYIIQGTRDTLVPPPESLELQSALQAAKVPVTYVTYDGEHGFSGIPPSQVSQLRLAAYQFVAGVLKP